MEGFLGGWLGTLGMAFTLLFFALPAITAIVIVLLVINYNAKKKAWEHEERMQALELGRPLPMPVQPIRKQKPYYPFAVPLVLMGIGLAFTLGGAIDGETGVLVIGAALLFSGGGLLASRFFGVRNGKDEKEESGRDTFYSEPSVEPGMYRDDGPAAEPADVLAKDMEKDENDSAEKGMSRFAPKPVEGKEPDKNDNEEKK